VRAEPLDFGRIFAASGSRPITAIRKVARPIGQGTMPRMPSATFTYFFMADDTRATDTTVPREWKKQRPSSSQTTAIVWMNSR
jgi:hypothetical protein